MAVYRPFTKSQDHARWNRYRRESAARVSISVRAAHGPVPHRLAQRRRPPDRRQRRSPPRRSSLNPPPCTSPVVDRRRAEGAEAIRNARRPIIHPRPRSLSLSRHRPRSARFVRHLRVPMFVTPKAKASSPADHPLFFGVCAGIAADTHRDRASSSAPISSSASASSRSNRTSSGTTPSSSLRSALSRSPPASTSPRCDVVGAFPFDARGARSATRRPIRLACNPSSKTFRRRADARSSVATAAQGVSPLRADAAAARALSSRHDHGQPTSVRSSRSRRNAGSTYAPLTFFESNGLVVDELRLRRRHGGPGSSSLTAPVLCTIGDGGFGMILTEVETCVRHGINFVTVVYNDSSLSLIKVSQEFKGLPNYGVDSRAHGFCGHRRGVWLLVTPRELARSTGRCRNRGARRRRAGRHRRCDRRDRIPAP